MIHELKTPVPVFGRVAHGELKALAVPDGIDYQRGDVLRLVRVNQYGNPTYHYVERKNGKFYHRNEQDEPIDVTITHVLPSSLSDGAVASGHVLLSVHLA